MNRINYRQIVNVRIFHATPTVPAVDIYINDRLVKEDLRYKQSTEYIALPRGNYQIRLNNSNTGDVLLNQSMAINENRYITIIALSDVNQIGLISLPDKTKSVPTDDFEEQMMFNEPIEMTPFSMSYALPSMNTAMRKEQLETPASIRFVHLSPNAPSVDVSLDGTLVYNDVIYKEASNYVDVLPKTYVLVITAHNSDQVVLRINNLVIRPNEIKTIYATGLLGGTPKLEAVILTDGRP
jgi:hypothetical protein